MQNGDQAEDLDRLRRQGEAVDRLRLRMKQRESGRGREHVAGEQPGERSTRRTHRDDARRLPNQCEHEAAKEDGRRQKASAGTEALVEVFRCEGGVDPRADRAGNDHGVTLQLQPIA
jgi:hypothetical protein